MPAASGRASTQIQPRRGFNEMVPEFSKIDSRAIAEDPEKWAKSSAFIDEFGCKGKVLSVNEHGDGVGLKMVQFGIPWTKDDFVMQARAMSHPFDRKSAVPPSIAS
eukprot:6496260-Karenia_brevis.AAC.1